MNYYQEVTIIEQGDVSLHHVTSAVYERIHTALCDHGNGYTVNIGISFPMYQYSEKSNKGDLGKKIRLFSKTAEELELIQLALTLESYDDYIHITSIKEVGKKPTHYEVYSRHRQKHPHKKATRLQAHLIKKYGQERFDEEFGSYEAVLQRCIATTTVLNLPLVMLKSNSNGHQYDVRLKREKIKNPTDAFLFNTYGLSRKEGVSAVPAW